MDDCGITPLVDTAEPKGQGKPRERPTAPEKRCLSFTRQDFEAVAEALAEGVPAGV